MDTHNRQKKGPAQLPTRNTKTKIRKKTHRKSSAVKELEAMANDVARKKIPEIPQEWLAPRKYRDDSANSLTKCIIDFLRFNGCQAERISNTGRPIDTQKSFVDVMGNHRNVGGMKWVPGTNTNGTADISATIAGKMVKIQVKIGSNRQSKEQKKSRQAIEQAGGIYIIVRTFEEFYQWYNKKFG
jgi:hypothetical protein